MIKAGTNIKFRKKPIHVEAIMWDGDKSTFEALQHWGAPVSFLPATNFESLIIGTLEDGPNCEAVHIASPGDWIIRGVEGEYYPCKPSIFDKSYEPFGHPE